MAIFVLKNEDSSLKGTPNQKSVDLFPIFLSWIHIQFDLKTKNHHICCLQITHRKHDYLLYDRNNLSFKNPCHLLPWYLHQKKDVFIYENRDYFDNSHLYRNKIGWVLKKKLFERTLYVIRHNDLHFYWFDIIILLRWARRTGNSLKRRQKSCSSRPFWW